MTARHCADRHLLAVQAMPARRASSTVRDVRGAPIRTELASPWTARAHTRRSSGAKLQAWSLPKDAVEHIALPREWPEQVTREWAWGGSTGKGVRVCILDSGVEASTSARRRARERRHGRRSTRTRRRSSSEDTEGDIAGHGTACAGIVRALAPECSISSVRVLGKGFTGSGDVLLAGLRYAIEQEFDVINMSLSTTKKPFAAALHELADSAYFQAQRCWSRRRTTCRSRATRGGSRR